MRLFLNATSPFARVARVLALEKGLNPELVWCDPWANDPALLAVHPQGRIPVLLTDDGHAIAESLSVAPAPRPSMPGLGVIAEKAAYPGDLPACECAGSPQFG